MVGERFARECAGHAHAPAMQFALGVAQARSGDHAAARKTLAAAAAAGGYERMDRVHYELAWACRRSGDLVPPHVIPAPDISSANSSTGTSDNARIRT